MDITPRKLALAAAVMAAAFLFLLPLFWPRPQIIIEIQGADHRGSPRAAAQR
jgi:hypothetical protein